MTTRRGISRRDVLRDIGVVATSAAAPGLAACGDDEGSSGQPPAAPVGITHIVVVMMENRTFDHYFGARSLIEGLPGDGLVATMSNPDLAGVSRSVYPETVYCVPDPPHGWNASHEQNGAGMNDGFLRAYQEDHGTGVPPHVMGYFARADLPVLYSLADAYTTCDRWFASVMGPTWPNRFYLHSAQSGGYKTNDFPPQAWPTIYDRLDAAGVDWMYYYSDLPFLLTLGNSRNQPIDTFYEEAKAGQLRPVTVVDPSFGLNDDHPPHHPLLGQQFIASIYQALATSPHWNNCLLVVTYDEHGGFFDHVPPPKAADDRAAEGFDQLGFRVPALLAGPYVKKGHVSSAVYDHASVLKHIETMFGLEPLTARDAAANDLSDAIDQARLAAG
jgi:phospholipase C